ncbi:MAG TPA: SOS response-associated peptidase [Candidatus Elarobacter sp.]|nr:SOS response-associated peptidase [Candidatus Elarobacter sp.]
MCGRASLASMPDELISYLNARHVRDIPPWYEPRYNIAPSQSLFVIRENSHRREARAMRWGLVPSWARDPSIGSKMINARAETVAAKPAYRDPFRRRRALIVIDGFYEWHREPAGPKTPYRIHRRDGAPFTLAGLWESRMSGDEALETCAVITTTANHLMSPIHDRMPVIIPDDAQDAWLAPESSPVALGALLVPDASDAFEAYAVTPYVNAPTHDDARCWERLGAPSHD